MNAPVRVGLFAGGLVVVFAAALAIGSAVGGDEVDPPESDAGSAGEFRLRPESSELEPSADADFRFTITDADDEVVTAYETAHEQELHLIVVRSDLSGFQHVHPTLATDGTWSVPLDLSRPARYRVIADFVPTGDDANRIVAADVNVAGAADPVPLPGPASTFEVDGYTVTLSGDVAVGQDAELRLDVERDGRPVDDLQPYLGAYGHLVALRSGDLSYLHVHPDGEPGDGQTEPGPGVAFHTTAPEPGTYRLYFDFRHGDVVRTAEFTVDVGEPAEPADGGGEHQHGVGS